MQLVFIFILFPFNLIGRLDRQVFLKIFKFLVINTVTRI